MATNAAEIEFVADEPIDFVPDEAPAAIDFVPDEVVQQEAQRASVGALQALDVMAAPGQLDWSAANEQLDQQRFTEAEQAEAQAKLAEEQGSGTGPGSEAFALRREADFQRGNISPFTAAGQTLERQGESQLQAIEQTGASERPETPSTMLSGFLGPGLSQTVQPVIESAGRNIGPAAGGALAAAKFIPHPGVNAIAQFATPMVAALMGSQAGGQGQEALLRSTETPEETEARQERAAEDFARNPGLSRIGAAVASSPFFGPSLAQFGRAAAGDKGAILNLGLAGTIGGGMEVFNAWREGKTADAADIAAGVFSNLIMNEPTRLGRRLGLIPSTEQAAVEAMQKYNELPPIELGRGPDFESGLTTRPTTSTADVFAGVPRRIEPPTGPKDLPTLENELLGLWPEAKGRLEDAMGGPWSSALRKRYEMLPKPRKDAIDRWFDTNEKAIVNAQDGEWFRSQMEGLSAAEDVAQFAAKLSDGISDTYDRFNGKKEALSEFVSTAGQIAQQKGIPSSEVETLLKLEFRKKYGNDAPEVLDFILNKIKPREPNAQQISETGTLDGGVRPPEVPSEDALVPTPEGGEGVQPSGQGESLAEAAPEAPREVTSIQNAVTAEERAARGIEAVEEPARRAFGDVWDAVKTEVAESPTAPDVLLAELKQKPRALTDREDALILHKQIELQNAFDKAADEVNQAAAMGDEPVRAEAMAQLERTRKALEETYTLGKQAGTETARGLAARKMMADRDFSLAAMETRLRAEQGGALTPEQQAKVKEQADTIAKTQEGMDKILAEREVQKAEVEADKAVDPRVKSLADRIIARLDITAANAAKSLRSRLREIQKTASVNPIPHLGIVADVAKIAAAKTAKGAIEFAQWSAEMIRDFGEGVRPFLQAGWDQREQHIDAEVNAGTRQARSKEKLSDSVRRENAKLKSVVRSIRKVESELAGGPRLGRQQGPESQAVAEARSELGKLRQQLEGQRAADPAIRQARMDAAEAAVERAITKLDEQLQAGDLSVQQRRTPAGTQRLEDLRAQRDAMNRLRNELRREGRPAADPIEAQTKARITTLANRTKEYQRRTAAGDFSPMRKPSLDLSKNPEWVKLKAENDAAKAAYEKSRYEARRAQRTTEQKVRDVVSDTLSASRSILASADISAVGRQGIFFALPDLFLNPKRLGRQVRRMFQSQFNEKKFQENQARLKSRPNADIYESSDLYQADIDHQPSAREEQFKSEIAEKVPGLGRIVRGSARGFASFMNEARADAMDAFIDWSGGRDKVSPETAKYLAAAINDLSGRGNVTSRSLQGALEWLARYLFSPRLWVSRLNTAILRPVWRDGLNKNISLRARATVAGQYLKFIGALYALKFLAGLNGGEMEEDPKDSDFGKLQFGSKRYDVMGGIGNMVTFLTRVFGGQTKDSKGKVQELVWRGAKRPDRDLKLVIAEHLRNKLAPIPGALFDLRYGVHPDRSKVTPASMLKQTTVPITVSDTVEMFQKDNPASALRDAAVNALGVTVQDHSR